MKDYPHDWQEVVRFDGCKGFYCKRCELFVKYNSTRPVNGCSDWLAERAKDILNQPTIDVPPNLSREEFREFILKFTKRES